MPPDDDTAPLTDEWVLPRPADRDWLNAGLARVLGQIGIEPFLRAPILTPEDRWFEDTPGHRRRFAAFLDRRWEEWRAGRGRELWRSE